MVVGVAACLLAACGPNFRSAYEADLYFQRCYTLDLDATVAAHRKLRCWNTFLGHYQTQQPPENLRYAVGRIHDIPLGLTVPVFPAGASVPSVSPRALASRSMDGSAPPQVAGAGEPTGSDRGTIASDAPPAASPPSAEPPGNACAANCRRDWDRRRGRCLELQDRRAECVASADDGYRGCMRGCY